MAAPEHSSNLLERVNGDGACLLRLRGSLNDRFDLDRGHALEPIVLVDLGGVSGITSPGVRLWSDWVTRVSSRSRVYLLNCPPAFIDQLNLVMNFAGKAEVVTARAFFQCGACKAEFTELVDVLRDGALLRSGVTPPFTCESCGGRLELEDRSCFAFVPRYGARHLEAAAAKLLAKTGTYSGEVVDQRPVEIQTLVEGEVTLIKLQGTIDSRFRWRRVVASLEGEVVLILSDTTLAQSGIASWNDFYMQLLKLCTHVTLVDLPPHMAMLNESGPINLGSAIVHSIVVPRYCAWCSDMRTQSVTLAQLVEAQASDASRGKSLPCQRCGAATEPVEGVVPLEPLVSKYRPTPPMVRDVIERKEAMFSQARVEQSLVSQRFASDPSHTRAYRIVRPLSSGGMAEVFLAMHGTLGGFEKPVALKRFRRELLEHSRTTIDMFLKEARLCANLNHPNIVQTLDVGEDEGDLFIAMEYVEGRDARAILQRKRASVPPSLAAHITAQVAVALDYAHNARDLNGQPLQIVHRDVSLQNVLIGFDGQVKLIDFGVALAGRQPTTGRRVLAGNFCYMSPEQCRGEPLDARTDLFSLGVVLHELLSGKFLFQRQTIEATITAVLLDPIPRLPNVPPALEAVVRRALERKRGARYQTASEMGNALRAAQSDLGGPRAEALGEYVRALFDDIDESPTSVDENDDELGHTEPIKLHERGTHVFPERRAVLQAALAAEDTPPPSTPVPLFQEETALKTGPAVPFLHAARTLRQPTVAQGAAPSSQRTADRTRRTPSDGDPPRTPATLAAAARGAMLTLAVVGLLVAATLLVLLLR